MKLKRILGFLLLAGSAAQIFAAPVQLSSRELNLEFDDANGQLRAFQDAAQKFNWIGAKSESLWQIDLQGDAQPLKNENAGAFQFTAKNRELLLAWSDFQLAEAPDLKVEAVVQLDENAPLSRWRIEVKNLGKLQLAKIHFPRIQNIARQENEFLAAPLWMGQVASNPRALLNAGKKSKSLSYDYPGHASMQCLAWYSAQNPGFYFSCDDTNAFRKNFEFFGDGADGANFEMIHLPENQSKPPQNFSLPYNVVLGTFRGDWFTAAEMYRSWATNQYWARESRLAKNVNPDWVPQTALWVWNRGRSENVIAPAIALQKQLGLPVSAFWHWWHGCSYDVGFPEYFPPREGEASFKKAVKKARANDVHEIVYMNQRLWGMTTESWTNEHAATFAVKDAEGKIRPEIYNTFTKSPCASMCMGTEFWRNKYAGLAERAFENLGVDGIYMDQACSSLACYDPTHGHPIGGGKYWMNGFRLLANDIRARTSSKNLNAPSERIALAGEGVGESWLPYLDLMLSLQVSRERYAAPDGWEPIPFFQAVYHPFAIQYGNYSSLTMPPYDDLWPKEFAPKEPMKLLERKFSPQFYLEQARAFVWGQQPTIANFQASQFKERPEEIAFALQLAKLRNRATKYLLHGTFLRPPEMELPEKKIEISRLSIYAGQQSALKSFEKSVSPVCAGAWAAKNGDVAFALGNISGEKISVELDLQKYELPKDATIYISIGDSPREQIGKSAAEFEKFALQLPARSGAVVEFVRR